MRIVENKELFMDLKIIVIILIVRIKLNWLFFIKKNLIKKFKFDFYQILLLINEIYKVYIRYVEILTNYSNI